MKTLVRSGGHDDGDALPRFLLGALSWNSGAIGRVVVLSLGPPIFLLEGIVVSFLSDVRCQSFLCSFC